MSIKSQTVCTIVLSFFIIIGAGHGIACIGLLEIGGLFNFFSFSDEHLSLLPTGSYDESLGAAALFALIGHIILTVSILIKENNKSRLKIIGIIFVWISFYYIAHNLFKDGLSLMGFLFGLPFLISSSILFYRVIRKKNRIGNYVWWNRKYR